MRFFFFFFFNAVFTKQNMDRNPSPKASSCSKGYALGVPAVLRRTSIRCSLFAALLVGRGCGGWWLSLVLLDLLAELCHFLEC